MVNRDIYKDEIDFAVLALQSPAFNKHLKSNGQLDFSNPEAVQYAPQALFTGRLSDDSEDSLRKLCSRETLVSKSSCQTIAFVHLFNYILWIQDLLDATSEGYSDRYNPEREVVGLDIGTGASCIYPLLGCLQRSKWRFAATDIDEQNIACARRNIIQNNLKSRIRPLLTKPNDGLIPIDALGLESIDFTICNPPFYASTADLLASAAAKSRPPRSACTGADFEMVTPGGEIAFVSRMIDESKILRERCQWYTSMLGKYSSVEIIVENLRGAGVVNWAVKDLVQGNKTRRWAVAWSWGSIRPSQDVARGTSTLPKHLLPFPSESDFHVSNLDIEACAKQLNETLHALDLRWQYRSAIATGVGFAKGNVWSRAARRKQQHQSPESTQSTAEDHRMEQDDDDAELALVCKVQLQQRNQGGVKVKLRWLQGKDSVLFESFGGILKRKLTH